MKTKAFYFSTTERKLRYGDDRDIVVGETHSVDGEIKVCRNGLHASERLIDALKYAPGCILYHVELSGDIDRHPDKLAARNRKYLAEFDATEVLKEFVRKQALFSIEKIKPYCSEEKYNLIVKFLETGDESLRKGAQSTVADAYAAVSAVSAVDAVDAARAAYYAADAAVDARAAYDAAYYAAYAAADAAISSQKIQQDFKTKHNEMLTQMIKQATGWDI